MHDNPDMPKWFALIIISLILPGCSKDKVEVTIHAESGLKTWKTQEQVFSLELVQLLPDFVRAVFAAKGLPADVVEAVSAYCVFGTIIRNQADESLSYDIRKWRYVTADGVEHHAKPKSAWVEEWKEQGIAFRWTLLYEAQTYAAGDWGQGFTTVKLPPGTHFDLHYSWQEGGRKHDRIIRDMACAPATLDN